MERIRGPFQGVRNIIRFNWPFYGLATLLILLVLGLKVVVADSSYIRYLNWLAVGITVPVLLSLLISYYIYDISDLYRLSWLDLLVGDGPRELVTINAGFDETSALLHRKFPTAHLHVFDFYDPELHTEASIKRARNAYPPYPGTRAIDTATIPLGDAVADYIFLMLAAHEIRQEAERVRFFAELNRVLKPSGTIIVVEHLRDGMNFLAYTVGFLHFLPLSAWTRTFAKAALIVSLRSTVTPFITTFVLRKNDSTP